MVEAVEVCKEVIKKKGVDHQLFKASEELGELIQAIGAIKTKCTTLQDFLTLRQNVVEEVIDVEVILMQLKLILQIGQHEAQEMLNYKINRLKENLDNE